MIEWLDRNPPINLTKYITDHQKHTNNDTGKEKYELIHHGVKTTNDQYNITQQKLY